MKHLITLLLLLTACQGVLALPALDTNPLHQLPAKEGKISYFASDDTGDCRKSAFGELLGERCGSTDATKYWYAAMRWPYRHLSAPKLYQEKEWWHNKKILVTNPANGKQVVVAAKDWGPAEWTGRAIDVSETALKALGAKTDDIVRIEFADQNTRLGIVDPTTTSCKIPVFDQTKYDRRLGTCKGCTLRSDGCVVTSLAMALAYYGVTVTVPPEHSSTGAELTGMDPEILNDWLTWKNGYNPTIKGCPGKCILNWQAIPGGITVSDLQQNNNNKETYRFIDTALASGGLVIAGVHWDGKKEASHHVLITRRTGSTYTIIDPYGGRETTLEKGTLGSYVIDHYRSIRGSKTQCSQTSWDFNTPGDLEGWEPHHLEAYSVEEGKLFIDPGGLDPWIQSPPIMADARTHNTVEFTMSSNAPDNIGTIYFTTTESPNYGEDKKVGFTVKTGPQWHNYRIYMANRPSWKGQITGVRIDPANSGNPGTNTDTIGFDNINLGYYLPKILDQSIYPNHIRPGEKLDFVYKIENPFSNNIENIRLGARIRIGKSQKWLDDWDRDKIITLTPGIKDYSRSFKKTQNLKSGTYDAEWVILNHKTSTWLDHKDMEKILQVKETPDNTPQPTLPTPEPETAAKTLEQVAELINRLLREINRILQTPWRQGT